MTDVHCVSAPGQEDRSAFGLLRCAHTSIYRGIDQSIAASINVCPSRLDALTFYDHSSLSLRQNLKFSLSHSAMIAKVAFFARHHTSCFRTLNSSVTTIRLLLVCQCRSRMSNLSLTAHGCRKIWMHCPKTRSRACGEGGAHFYDAVTRGPLRGAKMEKWAIEKMGRIKAGIRAVAKTIQFSL